ncbi:hypothetical protein [Microbacterium paulum]
MEARFAGGPITVGEGHATYDVATKLVTVDGPGWETALFPHEARALAAALTTVADDVEKRADRLRRRPEVDDHLRELDD